MINQIFVFVGIAATLSGIAASYKYVDPEHDFPSNSDYRPCPKSISKLFKPKRCESWYTGVFKPFLQNKEKKLVIEIDNGGSRGVGEMLKHGLPMFDLALKWHAELSVTSHAGNYWCGWKSFTRTSVPRNWKYLQLDAGARLWYEHNESLPSGIGAIQEKLLLPARDRNAELDEKLSQIKAGHVAPRDNQCMFFAFTSPSQDLRRKLVPMLQKLPKKYAGIHFRTVGVGSPVTNKGEGNYLRELNVPITQSPNSTKWAWRRHIHYVDSHLSKICARLPHLRKQRFPGGELSSCVCNTSLEMLIDRARMIAPSWPMFFTSDNAAVSQYLRDYASKWFIQSDGDPYHFGANPYANVTAAKDEDEIRRFPGDPSDASKLRTFVDMAMFSLATWVVASRASDFSLQSALLGVGTYSQMWNYTRRSPKKPKIEFWCAHKQPVTAQDDRGWSVRT